MISPNFRISNTNSPSLIDAVILITPLSFIMISIILQIGGITMHRTISDYKITKRKDGRYYVRIRDKGDVTHIYGKTKAEVKSQN